MREGNDDADQRVLTVGLCGIGATGRGGISQFVSQVLRTSASQVSIKTVELDPTNGGESSWKGLPRVVRSIICGRLSGSIDLLHLNVASRGSTLRKVILSSIARVISLPYVAHLHGGMFRDYYYRQSPLIRWLIRGMFKGAAAVIVLNDDWEDLIVESLGVRAERMFVVPNGVAGPASPAPVDRRSRKTVFVGRLVEDKGISELVQAWRSSSIADDATLTFIGDGSPQIVARLRAEGYVVTGWISSKEVYQLLDESSLLVLPSRFEAMPLSILEAFSRAVPVVATSVGGVPAMLSEGGGVMTPVGDVSALREAMESLLLDEPLRRSVALKARETWEKHYSTEIMVDRLALVWRLAAQVR